VELKARQAKPGDGERVDVHTPSDPSGVGNLAFQTKKFGKMMRHFLPKMPLESAELPQFFETVEKLYAMYEVPAKVQAKLLIPLLTDQAKSLVNQMSIDDISKYDELKEFLLTEYKLTLREWVRIACDYLYLSSFTVGDAYPMPTIDEVLRSIGKGQFISTFDARSGYYQIPLAEEHRWLTAFVTHDGLYEWLRMPFGLKNAGASFVIPRPIPLAVTYALADLGRHIFQAHFPAHSAHFSTHSALSRNASSARESLEYLSGRATGSLSVDSQQSSSKDVRDVTVEKCE